MPERFGDGQLEAVLVSVGRHLVVPAAPSVLGVQSLPDRQRTSRAARTALLAAAAVVALLLVAGAVASPVRDAVADWLGIGSTSIEQVPGGEADPSGLPSITSDAVPVTASEAREALGGVLPVVGDPSLGQPTLRAVPPEGGVLMVWARGQTTLWVHGDDGSGEVFVKKLLHLGDQATSISGLGGGAVLIEGEHVLDTPARRLSAGRVLLWVDNGLEYRLESDLPSDRMVEIARSVSTSSAVTELSPASVPASNRTIVETAERETRLGITSERRREGA